MKYIHILILYKNKCGSLTFFLLLTNLLYFGLNNIYFTILYILFYSILFYPITLGGRRGTTDEFATIPFHLDLFSAALVELAKSIPVHSLILSSHLFFCLPLFLFPFTVPCRIVFAKPEDLETWPNHLSFRLLTQGQEFIIFSNGCLDLSANLLIGNTVLI